MNATTTPQKANTNSTNVSRILAIFSLSAFLFLLNSSFAFGAKSTQDVDVNYSGYKFNNNRTVSLTFEVITRSKSGLNQIDFALPKTVQATDLKNSNEYFRYRMENDSYATYNAVSFKSIGQGPRDGQSDSFSYTLTDTDFFQLNSIEVQPKAGGPDESISFRAMEEPSILPVHFVSFTGKSDKNNIQLNWKTAQEDNNDKFEIERSLDGKKFTMVGTVKGQGTTHQVTSYQWKDAANLSGTVYYRLKQVDFDGKFEYSSITVVKSNIANALISVKAYPNPTAGLVSITGLDVTAPETSVSVFSASGHLLKIVKVQQPDFSLDLSDLQNGFYFLTITQNGQSLKLRVAKSQ